VKGITMKLKRAKTGLMQELCLACHRDNYVVCPLHSLAAHVAVSRSTQELFTEVLAGGESKYINELLVSLTELAQMAYELEGGHQYPVTGSLVSHSLRRGPAVAASMHPGVHLEWIVFRGGWTLSGIQTVFNYICGSMSTDSRTSLALSGWTSTEGGV
jgi:hypothetical protein